MQKVLPEELVVYGTVGPALAALLKGVLSIFASSSNTCTNRLPRRWKSWMCLSSGSLWWAVPSSLTARPGIHPPFSRQSRRSAPEKLRTVLRHPIRANRQQKGRTMDA